MVQSDNAQTSETLEAHVSRVANECNYGHVHCVADLPPRADIHTSRNLI